MGEGPGVNKTDSLRIVPMNAGHIGALVGIEKLCFSNPWSASALSYELTNPIASFWVAELGKTVAGYAGLRIVDAEGYIDNVAVHPDFRRRGIATALLSRLDDVANEKGLSLLTLEVRRSNQMAIRIYRKADYKDQGLRPGFYDHPREDALIMTKFYCL